MAQFSMEIMRLTGSVLRGNQHIGAMDFVVVKSGYHFTMNFAGIATPLLVETPGVGYYKKGIFSYEKSRFWPEHEVDSSKITAVVYAGVRAMTDNKCQAVA